MVNFIDADKIECFGEGDDDAMQVEGSHGEILGWRLLVAIRHVLK